MQHKLLCPKEITPCQHSSFYDQSLHNAVKKTPGNLGLKEREMYERNGVIVNVITGQHQLSDS